MECYKTSVMFAFPQTFYLFKLINPCKHLKFLKFHWNKLNDFLHLDFFVSNSPEMENLISNLDNRKWQWTQSRMWGLNLFRGIDRGVISRHGNDARKRSFWPTQQVIRCSVNFRTFFSAKLSTISQLIATVVGTVSWRYLIRSSCLVISRICHFVLRLRLSSKRCGESRNRPASDELLRLLAWFPFKLRQANYHMKFIHKHRERVTLMTAWIADEKQLQL